MVLNWNYIKEHKVYLSEGNVYCANPKDSSKQSLHIYVPEKLLNKDFSINKNVQLFSRNGKAYTAASIPIVFYNDIGGYAECSPAYLNQRNQRYLDDGYVLVSVGARGRQTLSPDGRGIGKAPAALVDLKAAVRWLRKHAHEFPGDTEKIISVGTSAGGAMSSLLGVSGNDAAFLPYLEEIGAAMDERDDIYAAQAYCPITNLEHADMAYEWMFHSKRIFTFSPKSKPEVLDSFQMKVSQQLREQFVSYLNSLPLNEKLSEDGRGGSFYEGIMTSLSDSLTVFLDRQAKTEVEAQALVQELNASCEWVVWENNKAVISDLDAYVQHYIGRMKGCPAFDSLAGAAPENQVFGSSYQSSRHFSQSLLQVLEEQEDTAPTILDEYRHDLLQSDLQEAVRLYNPINYLLGEKQSDYAPYFRIRLGSRDADTSFAISRLLYLALDTQPDIKVDYALIWGVGHCDADYNEEFSQWVDEIV